MKSLIALSGLAGIALFGHGVQDGNPSHLPPQSGTRTPAVALSEIHAIQPGAPLAQSRCRYEAEISVSEAAGAGDHLWVDAGSGSLEVIGVSGLTEARAVARACASHEEFLEELRVTAQKDGDRVVIDTFYPDWNDGWGWGNRYARLDLRIEVPEGMAAEIRDSSGEIRVELLGDLDIRDSSGEIEGGNLLGRVNIDDSSGEIILWDISGDVEIDDSSGEIQLEGVGGGVVLSDGSGEIDIRDVVETVRIIRDSSGSIDVEQVGGDFIVERDGSGSIHYRDIQGRVDVPRRRR